MATRATQVILDLLRQRGEEASICPSEAARALAPDAWREKMEVVRAAAATLAARGLVIVTQRGRPVTAPYRGPIRIRAATVTTPDGRYLVVRARLWRRANPALGEAERTALVRSLMAARREVARAKRAQDEAALAEARRRVHDAKVSLGERGPVWWTDGAPDENQRLVTASSYAAWWRRRAGWPPAQ